MRPPRRWQPAIVFIVMLAVTAGVTAYVAFTARARDELRFQVSVDDLRTSLERRLETYIALLRATTGLFAASDEVTRAGFRAFVDQIDLRGRYPGVQGIGFSAHVAAADRPALERRLVAEGLAGFRVWPDDVREDYHSIIYLEPLDRRNLAAIGYDMSTEAVRRAAMDRARDTGVPAASGKVTLVQEIDPQKQAGFLIYVPVYRRGRPVATVADRRAALTGFVYSPFRADDLCDGLFEGGRHDGIRLMVVDGEPPAAEGLLYDSLPVAPGTATPAARFTARSGLDVAGRAWTLVFTAGHGFGQGLERSLLAFVLLAGLLTTAALTAVLWLQVRARDAAERVAADLRRAQREREELLLREQAARAEAQAANRAKDEFLATLSHELRTPLNAVLGWTRLLRSGQFDAGRQAHALEVIERNARSQAELIEDLLDVSRIIAGKLRLDLRPVDLPAAVRGSVEGMRPLAEAKQVSLAATSEGSGRVVGDPDRLHQIVANLLSNAIKFTPSGGRVDVSVTCDRSSAVLTVRDTGIGIRAAFLPHIFERFRQADGTSTRAHGGMGLGLSIVRHLVESMQGTIRAESAGEGQGTAFTVVFPLLEAVEPESLGEKAAGPLVLEADLLAGVRVLVVDDDRDSRDVQASALEQAGAAVTQAASAADALRLLTSSSFDVIVSDLAMPDADGVAFMREVRAHTSERVRRTPAIALTAYARVADRDTVLQAGFQLYLRKPVEVVRLQSSVAWLTGRM